MPIIWSIVLMLTFIFLPQAGYASTAGNVDLAEFTLSLVADQSSRVVEGDGAILGHLRNSRSSLPSFDLREVRIENFDGNEDIRRLYIQPQIKIKFVSIFLRIGAVRATSNFINPVITDTLTDTAFGNSSGATETHGDIGVSSDSGYIYGIGLQTTVLKRTSYRLTLSGNYNFQAYDIHSSLLRDTPLRVVDSLGEITETTLESRLIRATTKEIELVAMVMRVGAGLTPYGGIKFSLNKTKYFGSTTLKDRNDLLSPTVETQTDSFTLKTDTKDPIGFFVGLIYWLTPSTGLNMEIRAGDETGLTARTIYLF